MGRPITFADGNDFDEAAMALDMTILCRDLHVLPKEGGLLDQDSYHMWLIETAMTVLNKHEKRQIDEEKRKVDQQSGKVTRR